MKKTTGTDRGITREWHLSTQLVRAGTMRSNFDETSEAIFMTSGFAYDAAEIAAGRFKGELEGYTYTRLSNPTIAMFEERMAVLEGAEVCKATGTGMAAISTGILCSLKAGDHVVSSRSLFGSCHYIITQVLPKFGIEVTLVQASDNAAWAAAARPNTRGFFLETPANPTLEMVDLEAVCAIARKAGAYVVVDNVFASPLLQKPLEYGADVVVYSATKHIDGQGRALGGAILCNRAFFTEHVNQFSRHMGVTASPFNAWLLLKGLETLDLRLERSVASAAQLAERLAARGNLPRVSYPWLKSHPQYELARRQMKGGGTVVTFEVPGGRDQAFKLLNSLGIIDISNNLGDSKSLMTHPASTTHNSLPAEEKAAVGITEGLVRLSVGLEDVRDLAADLDQALAAAGL